jgi:hypothetical protein
MQAQKDYFYSAFFTFIFLWFTRLYLFCPLFLFFEFTCVEFQVRIMLHFAYSIFYIKPQTISVVKCNDISLNSYAVLLSFFCSWWNGVKQDQYFSRMATNRSTFNFIQYSTSWYILSVYQLGSLPSQLSSISEHDKLCNFSLKICYALSVWE